MNVRNLSNLLNSLSPDDAAGDGVLLSRYLAKRSEAAFAALVRRHGRLIWTVCRNLTGSDADADDAFQATFVVLIEKAGTLKEPARLAPWLHGVAARICLAMRRKRTNGQRRERAIANSEHSTAVPESAWDRALAAVHEEAAQLPESLRVPFVLCCLEGRSVTETADQLGWKLGTLSGRLTRAKDRIVARLGDRGLVLGAIASIGLSIPPTASVARAATLATSPIPSTILELTQGAIAMNVSKIKLLAATVLATFGLGVIGGTGWFAHAQTQSKERTEGKPTAKAEQAQPKPLGVELHFNPVLQEAHRLGLEVVFDSGNPGPTFATKKWQYDLVEVSDMNVTKFNNFLQEREDNGWEFLGSTKLSQSNVPNVWVFRKPVDHTAADEKDKSKYLRTLALVTQRHQALQLQLGLEVKNREEIRKLEKQLAELKGRTNFYKDELPIDSTALANILPRLIEDKFKTKEWTIHNLDDGFALEASREIQTWVQAFVKKLAEK